MNDDHKPIDMLDEAIRFELRDDVNGRQRYVIYCCRCHDNVANISKFERHDLKRREQIVARHVKDRHPEFDCEAPLFVKKDFDP